MKAIKAKFVGNQQENDDTSCRTNAQPKDIDERVVFFPDEISKCDEEIVLDHTVEGSLFKCCFASKVFKRNANSLKYLFFN